MAGRLQRCRSLSDFDTGGLLLGVRYGTWSVGPVVTKFLKLCHRHLLSETHYSALAAVAAVSGITRHAMPGTAPVVKKKKDCVPALARAPWALAPLPAVSVRRGTTRRTTSRDRHYHSTGRGYTPNHLLA
jgi:hypothetical protein